MPLCGDVAAPPRGRTQEGTGQRGQGVAHGHRLAVFGGPGQQPRHVQRRGPGQVGPQGRDQRPHKAGPATANAAFATARVTKGWIPASFKSEEDLAEGGPRQPPPGPGMLPGLGCAAAPEAALSPFEKP